MTIRSRLSIVLTTLVFSVTAGAFIRRAIASPPEQDRYTLKAPNGVSWGEFKGYEHWEDVSVSQTPDGIKVILGNPAMMKAYRAGIPNNGKAFPEGAATVKIEWSRKPNPESPYAVDVPDKLKSVSFIFKNTKRFPDSKGWGYAQFLYTDSTKTFAAYGKDKNFGTTVCFQCHTAVTAKDYIFTAYSPH